MRTDELDYHLPTELIATRPAQPRDSARMMVVRRSDDSIEHRRVSDLPSFLRPDDVMVFNTTAVAPARVIGKRADSGGKVEGLLLEPLPDGRWRGMFKSNSTLRPGQRITLEPPEKHQHRSELELIERDGAEWIAQPRDETFSIENIGWTPLPPYILRARGDERVEDELDRQWYQTVYAKSGQPRSVAAPTAGLHFTPELLEAIDRLGVRRQSVMLHVGPGTFKPIETETLEAHPMHREHFEVGPEMVELLGGFEQKDRRQKDQRLLAVGTTTVRALESLPDPLPHAASRRSEPIIAETDLLIAPPYDFRFVDGLLTNFHLPRSTLLALVGALVGLDRLKALYREAVSREYRFYSYGDAMLIVP